MNAVTNVCKKCGVVRESRNCKACSTARSKAWAAENRSAIRVHKAKWAAANPEYVAAKSARWAAANPERVAAISAGSRERNRVETRVRAARKTAEMSNFYIANLLRLPVSQCPPDLISLKREQLRFYRLARQLAAALNEVPNQGEVA
jgi:hypothetical protein